MDVKSVFLNGGMKETVYVRQGIAPTQVESVRVYINDLIITGGDMEVLGPTRGKEMRIRRGVRRGDFHH